MERQPEKEDRRTAGRLRRRTKTRACLESGPLRQPLRRRTRGATSRPDLTPREDRTGGKARLAFRGRRRRSEIAADPAIPSVGPGKIFRRGTLTYRRPGTALTTEIDDRLRCTSESIAGNKKAVTLVSADRRHQHGMGEMLHWARSSGAAPQVGLRLPTTPFGLCKTALAGMNAPVRRSELSTESSSRRYGRWSRDWKLWKPLTPSSAHWIAA